MEETKKWYASKAVWGSLITVGAVVAGGFGIAISQEEQEGIADAVMLIVAGAGGLFSIYGRIRANKQIK